jgi:tuftelin-interacting protein 11
MSPFESWLWHAWLPKVRSAINNDWLPQDPSPAIRLYEAWSNLLPAFIRDNFFDQLVLPKVNKAIADWSPKNHTVSLHTLILPWLPHVGLREDELLGEAKRKVKSLMRDWKPVNEVPNEVLVWKDVSFFLGLIFRSEMTFLQVMDSSDWEELLLKYVVPKLGAVLREDFQVNPANQDMNPLKLVLSWSTILRPNIFSQLLESQFFPKWLRTLHQWLVHPKASFEEIAQWYSFWKGAFPDHVQQMTGVERGFSKGLQLINKALELGPEASARLPPPEVDDRPQYDAKAVAASIKRPSRTQEITFRSIVEDFVASHNLLFIPVGRVEEKSRMPLYRISKTADGKGGLLVYVLDDAIWALVEDEYRAIGLEDVVLRANKR